MELDKLTIGEAKQLAALFCGGDAKSKRLPITVGQKLFIMTITAHFTGEVTAVAEDEIELTDTGDDLVFHAELGEIVFPTREDIARAGL